MKVEKPYFHNKLQYNEMLKYLEKAETSTRGYFIVEINTATYYYTKTSARIMANTTPDSLSSFYNAIIPDDKQAAKEFIEQAIQQQNTKNTIIFRVHHKEKMPAWIKCVTTLIKTSKLLPAPLLIVCVEDISNATNFKNIVDACMDGTSIRSFRTDKGLFSGTLFSTLPIGEGIVSNVSENFNNMLHEEDKEFHHSHFRHTFGNRIESNRMDYRVDNIYNEPIWISHRNKITYDDDGSPEISIGGFIDITKLRNYNYYVEKTIETSLITGLPNRLRLHKDLSMKAKEDKEYGYILFINVDNFNNINNTFDYNAGNQFLREFAYILKENSPPGSTLYNSSADNFELIIPYANVNQALWQMRRYKSVTGAPFVYDNTTYLYTISTVGVSYIGQSALPDIILKKSTIGMQKIKMEGKNRYLLFRSQIFKEYRDKLDLESKLRDSVASHMNNFYLVYQPFVDAGTNKCIGAEALLRWRTPNGDVVAPDIFIPILENTGLLEEVGTWVFQQATKQCRHWLDQNIDPNFYISINANTPQISSNTFAEMVLHCIQEAGIHSQNIVIEITESTMTLDFQRGMKQLNLLKQNGVRLAIDDFGTGYSSLSYLKQLPVDKIKIDRTFVKDIETDSYSREFVASIIKITKSIGRVICLEGVETQSQMDILKEMDSDIFQGFLFSRPLEPELFKYKLIHNLLCG